MAGMKSGIKSSIIFGLILSLGLTLSGGMQVKAADDKKADKKATNEKTVTLRISNWEEYLDEGDWDEEDTISLVIPVLKILHHRILTDDVSTLQIKDNVRDSYFAALGALKSDLLTSDAFKNDPNYHDNLEKEMNDASPETIAEVQEYLQDVKKNAVSFESDSGKADMITGKVVANLQWSGDGVYTLDQADEDDFPLEFAVPEEATNIYFDGWVMLKSGVHDDAAKQQAAEAFINFTSRPDNVIRNMNYVGYTSVIAGGNDPRIFEYADWCYGAEDDETDVTPYDLSYFFSGEGTEGEYVIHAPTDQVERQLFAQYPDQDAISRSSIMLNFDDTQNQEINQMWISVRCYDVRDIPIWVWVLAGTGVLLLVGLMIRKKVRQRGNL